MELSITNKYISLGSLNTDLMDFYKMCICAFEDTDYYVCMSIGTKCEVDQLGELPDNFLVKNVFPQLEILDKADAFITHAGFKSILRFLERKLWAYIPNTEKNAHR